MNSTQSIETGALSKKMRQCTCAMQGLFGVIIMSLHITTISLHVQWEVLSKQNIESPTKNVFLILTFKKDKRLEPKKFFLSKFDWKCLVNKTMTRDLKFILKIVF